MQSRQCHRLLIRATCLHEDFGAEDIVGIKGAEELHVETTLFINETTRHFIDCDDAEDGRNIRLNQIVDRNSQGIKVSKS